MKDFSRMNHPKNAGSGATVAASGAPVGTAPVRPAGHALLRRGRASFLVHRRAVLVAAILAVLLLAAAVLVYLFAWRGGLQASRFVLIGIGVSVALGSLTQLFLTKGDFLVAQQAKVWLTGSLNSRGYDQAAPLATVLLLAVPATLWAARAQRGASLDDDTAVALGIRLDRVRLGLTALGIVLASVATGAAGPIDFVALLAPQIARRLTRSAQIPLLSSALAGALVVVVADLLARRLFSPVELPVGVLTAAVGAPYLMWLIARTRSRSGGTSS
ncbi:iron chelate uptake ABC transporter family permease subunit [Streptomyces sp. NBC_00102]|uniref:FecCD family ABC transporter permease n=1 Tax=Streptomyces sp. NBC_00102 TaxID=2975652 RepID=UPI00225BDAB1|nr:iron chelate uptake ABC transporter family permease subunit [Streptomyces sp. NBC_00102]MCX5402100.1 iron chelate uptake ABC transporter family permease subunit [Streptomyces sp. NBC_00102]